MYKDRVDNRKNRVKRKWFRCTWCGADGAAEMKHPTWAGMLGDEAKEVESVVTKESTKESTPLADSVDHVARDIRQSEAS